MKQFLFLLFFPLFGFNQILDAKKEWFVTSGFFNALEIKENKIKSMEFLISMKKDGDIIKSSSESLFFSFNRDGQQIFGKRILENRFKNDTTVVLYQYNRKGLLSSKIDEFSVFSFRYNYLYSNKNELVYEVKLDAINKRYDTLFERTYSQQVFENKQVITTHNSSKKPFFKKTITRKENLETIRSTYIRNRKYLEVKYFYTGKKLAQKEFFGTQMGSTVIREEYQYKSGLLDEVNIYENGILKIKRGIIYDPFGLPIHVIERQYESRLVKLYEIKYSFY